MVARAAMYGWQTPRLALHVAVRVCDMRTMDFDAWKKPTEVWRRREKGRQEIKVGFERKPFMKFKQLSVRFPAKP